MLRKTIIFIVINLASLLLIVFLNCEKNLTGLKPPDNFLVVYRGWSDGGNNQIMLTNIMGDFHYQLTHLENIGTEVAWSPDAREIVFLHDYRESIYLLSSNGSLSKIFTAEDSLLSNLQFSPDGGTILFVVTGMDDSLSSLCTIKKNGTGLKYLTSFIGRFVKSEWSPDGEKIVFSDSPNGNSDIFVIKADGSSRTALTNSPLYEGEPAWSPDGKKIVYSSYSDKNSGAWVMNADGSEKKLLRKIFAPNSFNWSPDGKRIVFLSYVKEEGALQVFVMDQDGSNLKHITHTAYHFDPQWTPDGSYIVYVSGYNIIVKSIETGLQKQITNYHEWMNYVYFDIAPVVTNLWDNREK